MNAFRCLHAAARPALSSAPALLRPSLQRIAAPQPALSARPISLLAPRRPQLSYTPSFAAAPSCTTTPAAALDLMPSISAHPAFGSMQIRCGPRDTYSPSHLVRKRRHGFLTRLKTKKGRMLLMRRIKRGKVNLSH